MYPVAQIRQKQYFSIPGCLVSLLVPFLLQYFETIFQDCVYSNLNCSSITFLKNNAKEPVFFGLLGVALLVLGVVGADDGLTGLDVGDAMELLGASTLPARGDVTCTVVEVLGNTTA